MRRPPGSPRAGRFASSRARPPTSYVQAAPESTFGRLTVAQARAIIDEETDPAVVGGWFDEEATSEKPRKGLLDALTARLEALTAP
jgi:hypothetical protein